MARKKRIRFHIALDELDTPEISLKQLAKSQGIELAEGSAEQSASKAASQSSPSKLVREEWEGKAGNILTQLEQKYCGHSKIRDDEEETGAGGTKKRKKRDAADDEYDLDDPFIDDSDLLEVFEKQEAAESTITKYNGFFVNVGDLEVAGHKEPSGGPMKEKRRRTKKVKPTSASPAPGTAAGGGGGGAAGGTGEESTSNVTITPGNSGGGAAAAAATVPVAKEEPSTAEMEEAALTRFKKYVSLWKEDKPPEDILLLQELPRELERQALDLDLVMRGGAKMPNISSSYLETLRNLLSLSGPAWKRGLKSAATVRVTEIDRDLETAKVKFVTLYNTKRDIQLKNKEKAAATEEGKSPAVDGATSPQPVICKSIPIDNNFKICLTTILTLLREKTAIEAIHPLPDKEPPTYEVEEAKILAELAENWPNCSMKPQRLRKAFHDYTNKEKQKALNKAAAAANGGDNASVVSATSVTVGELNGIKKKPVVKRKVSDVATAGGTEGKEKPKKPRKKKESPTVGAEGGGGAAVPIDTDTKGNGGAAAAAATTEQKKKKKKRKPKKVQKVPKKPKGPIFGLIVVPEDHKFNPADFEVENA